LTVPCPIIDFCEDSMPHQQCIPCDISLPA
jgi:hypothetical protein